MTDEPVFDEAFWAEVRERAERVRNMPLSEVLAARVEDDPVLAQVLMHAQRDDCCMNESWRGYQCEYHRGYEDGLRAALGDE